MEIYQHDNIEELWRRALKAIETCQCAQGCPSCIQAGRGREAGFKKSDAKTVLDGLLGTWLHY
ncbi:DEAD/DEAH-box helicase, putative [Ostreococcus tauri]|uniref:DEAD/DEAH-box helicase, putative n=1 Tax=Ostreococcus tauri TaxID=70448 RepID=Q01BR8_OSTTA|nr:DEAD/DEAH-box helicase, putative [Ostreococcus tauri]CAL53240.1 DEAD/DEAH-box helicase, putative [Ostreococcus tauri]|eukprot:XP_003078499.1 DEAD/DEAH-box helicase, putative [Ostreococcus tauri]